VYGLYVCIGPPTKDLLIFFPFELWPRLCFAVLFCT
jgi:hypothetical protein